MNYSEGKNGRLPKRQITGFDYSLIDKRIADNLKSFDKQLNTIYNNYTIEVGKILHRAQQEFANPKDGVFIEWIEYKGFKKSNAYNYINIYKAFQSLESNYEKEIFKEQPKSLQNEMSKPSANKDLNKKVFDGDVTTHKQYIEQQRTIKEQEERIKELENQPPQVIKKEVTKEVVPNDYDGLKSDVKQLSQALKDEQVNNKKMRAQLNQMIDEREEVDKKSKKYDELTSAIKEMEGKMDAQQKRIAAVKDVTDKLKVGNQLIDELSGLIYLIDYEDLSRNKFLTNEIGKLLNRLDNFINDFSDKLDKNTILEGEIIND